MGHMTLNGNFLERFGPLKQLWFDLDGLRYILHLDFELVYTDFSKVSGRWIRG